MLELLELFLMPIKIFRNEFISKISYSLFILNEVLAFKNNVSNKYILTFSLDLTLCCELQRYEISLIIKILIEFTNF